MREVFIAGVGMTPFGRFDTSTVRSLATAAVNDALADAGVDAREVSVVFFANAVQGYLHGQEMVRGQMALRDTGLLGVPLVNVENACASGATAAHLARTAVASGQHEIAVVVGAEKLTHPDRARSLDAIGTAVDLSRIDELRSALGTGDGVARRSLFMDIYADAARHYSERTRATRQDYALVATKNRAHARHNPRAQYRDPVTVEEVLASREISAPLTLLMCSPLGDGAAALVLCSREVAERAGHPLVNIGGAGLVSGNARDDDSGAVPRAARQAYEQAGIGPDELDVVELHDAASSAELEILEELAICAPGDAPGLLNDGHTRLGGRIPVNPSGGLIARGHPIGATGCAQLAELTDQLRGRATNRQVPNARIALAQNAGGHLGPDPAVACVTVLRRR